MAAAKADVEKRKAGDYIKEEKLDEAALGHGLEAAGLSKAGKPIDRAKRLCAHYWSTTESTELVNCDDCSGDSPKTLTECPYCGYSEPTEASPSNPTPPANVVAAAKPEKAKKGVKSKDAVAPEPKEPKAKLSLVKAEVAGKATVHTTVNDTDLDVSIREIRRLKSIGALTYWQLGNVLLDVEKRQLWKQRVDDEGTSTYKVSGFDAFVREECGFTKANAYMIMDVAKNYSEEQVKAFGVWKLGLVLRAPTESQAKILEESVAGGKSYREINDLVKEAKTAAGEEGVRRDTGRRPNGAGGGRKPSEREAAPGRVTKKDYITIASIPASQRVPLHVKGTGKKGVELKAAKRLADIPTGTIDFENGVHMTVSVEQKNDGTLFLSVKVKRDEETEG